MKRILVTGGLGFIGSALIKHTITHTEHKVLNIDKKTYAAMPEALAQIENNENYAFEKIDITSDESLKKAFRIFKPDAVIHLAAESHVDRSIDGSEEFIQTNIVGTYRLLEQTRNYYQKLNNERKKQFRFQHISTDEVYGDLKETNNFFTESTAYDPSSPYSASKASSDHLVMAWYRTYELPIIISNCSNNYGPYQFPEKLIPHIILNALNGKLLPLYGDGSQIRDWLFVEDHARALLKILADGKIGETYNIGGHNQKKNIEVVEDICDLLDELVLEKPKGIIQYRDLITYVTDRPGHDTKYAIDASKMQQELGWAPKETFDTGLRKTVQWYLDNREWWEKILSGAYRLERIGKGL